MKGLNRNIRLGIFIAILAVVQSPLASDDHEQARMLHESGEIVSLESITKILKQQGITRILEAELERENGVWVYEIEYLDSSGKVHEQYFDARTGQLIKDSD